MNAQLVGQPVPTSISQFAPGIYPDIPAEVYHRPELGMVSAGVLRLLAEKTPAHYRH